jgi:hypothetical protein
MIKSIAIVVLVMAVSACKPSIKSTPTISPPTMTPSSVATPSVPESRATVLPSEILTSMEEPTVFPTSTFIEGWLVYQNDRLGYKFSYPSQAKLSSLGPDSYSPEDVPPDIKLDYFALLESIYPDNLCVGLEYEMGFVIIKAPPNKGGKFVTCGVTGVGDYDVVEASETVSIGGQLYSAHSYKVYDRDSAATFRNEFFFVELKDGTTIDYGGYWKDYGATYEDYISVKGTLLQILASYRTTVPESICGFEWSRLYPGSFTTVIGDSNGLPNRVRSLPDTSAQLIAQIRPGQIALVLEGPTCSDGLVFWKVQSDSIPGGLGWTVEGDGIEYYLVPYHR